MTTRVNGPTNIELISLSELNPYQVFADPEANEVYIYLEAEGGEIHCLRLSPTMCSASLNPRLEVQRVNLNIDWSYQ